MTRPGTSRKKETSSPGTPDDSFNRAKWAAWAAEDKKALGVVILDVAEVSSLADFFLICSATSGRQAKAIADHIDETLTKKGIRLAHAEGFEELSWVLLDYDDLVVHIFSEEARDYYHLEGLWADARRMSVPAKDAV